MPRPFLPAVTPPEGHEARARVVVVRASAVLVASVGETADLPGHEALAPHIETGAARHYLGALDDVHWFAVGVEEHVEPPEGMAFETLRPLWSMLDEDTWAVAGRAVQIVEWDQTHRFCGRCGGPTELAPEERARRCPACGLSAFPRVAPAVIVRVTHDDRILLARGTRFPGVMYSVLAGFVEPGESLEECVAREIEEEVGIRVADIRYFGSQPWPFPHSLMIGFTASYAGGEIAIDPVEIMDAQWFTRDALPPLPPRISIARHLIDAYVHGTDA